MSTKYSPKFKEQAVALYLKSGTTYAAVARELGCDAGSLSDWVKKAQNSDGSKEGNPFQTQEEIRLLRRECYIDGIWNKDSVDEWLTEVQLPVK